MRIIALLMVVLLAGCVDQGKQETPTQYDIIQLSDLNVTALDLAGQFGTFEVVGSDWFAMRLTSGTDFDLTPGLTGGASMLVIPESNPVAVGACSPSRGYAWGDAPFTLNARHSFLAGNYWVVVHPDSGTANIFAFSRGANRITEYDPEWIVATDFISFNSGRSDSEVASGLNANVQQELATHFAHEGFLAVAMTGNDEIGQPETWVESNDGVLTVGAGPGCGETIVRSGSQLYIDEFGFHAARVGAGNWSATGHFQATFENSQFQTAFMQLELSGKRVIIEEPERRGSPFGH